MPATLSKLPTSSRPIINDLDMAHAVEKLLAPHSGKALERAQMAVRKVASSAAQGTFEHIVAAYRTAITAAVGDKGDKEG